MNPLGVPASLAADFRVVDYHSNGGNPVLQDSTRLESHSTNLFKRRFELLGESISGENDSLFAGLLGFALVVRRKDVRIKFM